MEKQRYVIIILRKFEITENNIEYNANRKML